MSRLSSLAVALLLLLAGVAQAQQSARESPPGPTAQSPQIAETREVFRPFEDPKVAQVLWGFFPSEPAKDAACRVVMEAVEQIGPERHVRRYALSITMGQDTQYIKSPRVLLPEGDVPQFRKLLDYVAALDGSATKAPVWQYQVEGYGFTLVAIGARRGEETDAFVELRAKGQTTPGARCAQSDIPDLDKGLDVAMEKLTALK